MTRRDELLAALHSRQWKYELLHGDSGGTIVVLERGGRIIGAYPGEEDENMLWVDPDIGVERPTWNSGGERVWLSPEVDYFMTELESPGFGFTVQEGLDPGGYTLEGSSPFRAALTWTQVGDVRSFRAEEQFRFRLSKSCRLIDNPLVAAGLQDGGGAYNYMGYETETVLKALDKDFRSDAALWTLMQVPSGGVALVPTIGKAVPVDFFAADESSAVRIMPGGLRFRLYAEDPPRKLSIRSIQATGRIGYFRMVGQDRASLLVRQFSVYPSESYVDVPPDRLSDRGHCVQCYNDGGRLGGFGELEYHTPVLRRLGTSSQTVDVSQVWCYSGHPGAMRELCALLLGVNPD